MKQSKGFTLIELSIVLVIIALIVGGVLVGKDLIEVAKIRSFVSAHQKISTAVYAFKDKYNQIPGDMPNAYTVFGTACGANSINVYSGCNGRGGSCLENGTTECDTAIYIFGADTRRFFVHMALAGLMDTNYVTDSVAQTDCSRGVTFPAGELDSVYMPTSRSRGEIELFYFKNNAIHNGSACNTTFSAASYFTTPLVTSQIDSKIDDGNAMSGRMKAQINHFQETYTASCNNTSTGIYNATYVDPICKFGIRAF